jgi:hypothetical protein
MRKKNLFAILIISFGVAAITSSCTQAVSDVASSAALTSTSTDEAQVASISDAVVNLADANANTLAANGYSLPMAVKGIADVNYPIITVDKPDSLSFPKTITIDYGTAGYITDSKDTLQGKIIITISNKLWKAGATKTIQTVDFYINGNNVIGKKTITNNGLNAAKNPSMTVVASDTIMRVDKSTIIRNATRTRERISDNGTPKLFFDDKFSITGSAAGVNAKGVAYTVEITSPLIEYNNFKFFVQGTVTTTTQNRTAVLDYGDGTRDNKATLTINGVAKEIILRK